MLVTSVSKSTMHTANPLIASVSKTVPADSPICHDLGLWLRLRVAFAVETEADIASVHVTTTAVAQIGNLLFRRLAVGRAWQRRIADRKPVCYQSPRERRRTQLRFGAREVPIALRRSS